MKIPTTNAGLDWFGIPTIIVLSVYVVGIVTQGLFGFPDFARVLFTAIGGAGFLIEYYRRLIPHYMPKKKRAR